MLEDMLVRANSVCLLALARSDRRVLALLLVRVDKTAVLSLRYGRYPTVVDTMYLMMLDHMIVHLIRYT